MHNFEIKNLFNDIGDIIESHTQAEHIASNIDVATAISHLCYIVAGKHIIYDNQNNDDHKQDDMLDFMDMDTLPDTQDE